MLLAVVVMVVGLMRASSLMDVADWLSTAATAIFSFEPFTSFLALFSTGFDADDDDAFCCLAEEEVAWLDVVDLSAAP